MQMDDFMVAIETAKMFSKEDFKSHEVSTYNGIARYYSDAYKNYKKGGEN